MNNKARKLLYDVHGWAGFVVGIALMIVCVSGAVAVFAPEIDRWSNPSLHAKPDAPVVIDPDRALAGLASYVALAQKAGNDILLEIPNGHLPGRYGITYPSPQGGIEFAYLDASTGEILPPRQNHVFYFLRHLHVRLLYTRLPVGIVGAAMLLSIATGLLIYKHILRDMFRMRWRREGNVRVTFADFHKLIGFWALLFHIVIASTGTWLALEGYLNPVIAKLADRAPVRIGEGGGGGKAIVKPDGTVVPLATIVARSRTTIEDFEPAYISLESQDGRTQVRVRGNVPGLVQENISYAVFDRATGKPVKVFDVRQQPFWTQFRYAIEPIHYGYFGGFWVKLLYLVVGLMPAVLTLTGALLWFERRRHENSASAPLVAVKGAS